PQMGMWCCVGTGMENHGKYGELIYAHNANDLYVNFFIPSTLNWKEKGLQVEQQTAFPNSETTTLKITIKKPQQFAILFRYPSWVKEGALKAFVNKKAVQVKRNENSYASVKRVWKTGDVLTIQLPMEIKAEFLPDSSSWVSFVRGPIVLAAATDTTGLKGLKADDSRMGHVANGPSYPIEEAPMIVTADKNSITSLQPVKGKALTYTAASLVYPAKYKDLQLVPFYTIHDSRYMLYWRYATPAQLETIKEEIRKREEVRLALEKITVDQVAPGEQQPESDHAFKAEQTEAGVHKDRHWRTAKKWFSYELKNTDALARTLRITYYGQDRNRLFDIYVNDVLLQTVELNGAKGDQFFDVDYTLPAELVKEKLLTVKFVAKENSIAGGIYYVRLLK
ncbi:MAG: glycosyl hydrolase, partial [Chitinophagaceae bacterium]|nr:glycosyl hydrolase [Chitinophagaceae bacterium]